MVLDDQVEQEHSLRNYSILNVFIMKSKMNSKIKTYSPHNEISWNDPTFEKVP